MTDELTFIGTATTILRLGPFTLLTDPNFLHQGELAYLGYGLFSRRLTEPALAIGALPPLDGVVLSHMHGDHWDRRARAELAKDLPIITTRHAARRLRTRDRFPAAVGLGTWQSHRLDKGGCTLTVTSLPGVHSTNPVLKAMLPPVMGSLLELADGDGVRLRVYLTGDTMVFDGIDEIGRRHPDIDAAVLHVGRTTLPGGFVVTMGAEHARDCLGRVRPRVAIPIHYGDYGVFKESLEEFRRGVDGRTGDVQMRYVDRGGTVALG
jgi:L-ascorbate metabolism protein UlaG (beta-lactamase superfamily)